MTGTGLPLPDRSRFWSGVLIAAMVVGAVLRLQQIRAQVLIDDEWHAVHQLLRLSPAQMFVDFGHADYSIPLGLLDGLESRWFGLSETMMRVPINLDLCNDPVPCAKVVPMKKPCGLPYEYIDRSAEEKHDRQHYPSIEMASRSFNDASLSTGAPVSRNSFRC